MTLREYLDEVNALIVLFDDVRLAYIDGQVCRDETLLDGGKGFLQYFRAEPSLSNVISEKGQFTAVQTAFDGTSTFGAIVDDIGADDAILLCDDLGDEWADFIGVKEEAGLTWICFYHAKHGALSLGASPFHVSISQATKNLGNMTFPEERLGAKLQTWGALYVAPNQALRDRFEMGRKLSVHCVGVETHGEDGEPIGAGGGDGRVVEALFNEACKSCWVAVRGNGTSLRLSVELGELSR